jgi:hypothetical protein
MVNPQFTNGFRAYDMFGHLGATEQQNHITQTLQVGTLNGSFPLIFQGFIAWQATKWKRLLLVVDQPSSPRKMASWANH